MQNSNQDTIKVEIDSKTYLIHKAKIFITYFRLVSRLIVVNEKER